MKMIGENLTMKRLQDTFVKKLHLEETDFLSDKTKDQFRSLYRLIAERIKTISKCNTKPDLDKFQKAKNKI